MTSFREQLKKDMAAAGNAGEAGLIVTYRPKKGLPVQIVIFPDFDEGGEQEGADDFGMTEVVGIQASDIEKVERGDRIEIPAVAPFFETWEVLYAKPAVLRTIWKTTISKIEG